MGLNSLIAAEVPAGFTPKTPGVEPSTQDFLFNTDQQFAAEIPDGFAPEKEAKEFWFQGIMDQHVEKMSKDPDLKTEYFDAAIDLFSGGMTWPEAERLKDAYIERAKTAPGHFADAGIHIGEGMLKQVIDDMKRANDFVSNPLGSLEKHLMRTNPFDQETSDERKIRMGAEKEAAKLRLKKTGEKVLPAVADTIDFAFGPFIKLSRGIQSAILPAEGKTRPESVMKDMMEDPGVNPLSTRIFRRIDDAGDSTGETANKMVFSAVTGAIVDIASFNPRGVFNLFKNMPAKYQTNMKLRVLAEAEKDLPQLKNIYRKYNTEVAKAPNKLLNSQIDKMEVIDFANMANSDGLFSAYFYNLSKKVARSRTLGGMLESERGALEFAPESGKLKSNLQAVIASTKMPNIVAANQAIKTLINAGLKKEEIEFSGIENLLKTKDRFTKQELVDYVDKNKVKVEVITKGELTAPGQIAFENAVYDHPLNQDIEAEGYKVIVEPEGQHIELMDEYDDIVDESHLSPNVQEMLDQVRIEVSSGPEGATKFGEYVLPGGENYQEHLIQLQPNVSAKKALAVPARTTLGEPKTLNAKTQMGEIEDITGQFMGDYLEMGVKNVLIYPKGGYIFELDNGDYWTEVFNEEYTANNLELVEEWFLDKFGGEIGLEIPQQIDFKGGHFAEKNILAHVRTTDRYSQDGNKVLFIEEVQSDWHLAGKQKGYAVEPGQYQTSYEDNVEHALQIIENNDVLGFDSVKAAAESLMADLFRGRTPREAVDAYEWDATESEENIQVVVDYLTRRSAGEGTTEGAGKIGVPDAPFKKSWHELALKQMIEKAVREGYDEVAFISGAQTADRYNLSKQVDEIEVDGFSSGKYDIAGIKDGSTIVSKDQIPEAELANYVGKPLAEKIIADTKPEGQYRRSKVSYSGDDLKLGGNWAFKFYDEILPKTAEKYIGQWGGKVKDIKLPFLSSTAKVSAGFKKAATEVQKGFEITPAMRQEVSRSGQPMFGNRLASPDLKSVLKDKKGFSGRPDPEPLPDDFANKPEIFDLLAAKEAFGTKDPYIYHLSPKKLTAKELQSFKEKGLTPSTEDSGYSGAGVYMSNNPIDTQYYAEIKDGTLFRVDKTALIAEFGVYPKNPDGVQFDEGTNEVLLAGTKSVPPEFIEVQTATGWEPLVTDTLESTRKFKQTPPFKMFAKYAENKFWDKDIKPPLVGHHVTLTMERVAEFLDDGIMGPTYKVMVKPVYDAAERMQLEGSSTKKAVDAFKIIEGSKEDRGASLYAQGKATNVSESAKRAANYVRAKYDEYLTRLNEVRKKVGVEPINKRQDYITHLNELNVVSEIFGGMSRISTAGRIKTLKAEILDKHPNWSDSRAAQSAKRQVEASAGMEMYIDAKQPIFNFAKKRLGEYEADPSILRSFNAYMQQALRYIHQGENVARNKAYKDLLPTNAKRYAQLWNTEQVAGRTPPSPIDPGVKRVLMDLRGTFGANTILGNMATTMMQLTSWPQVIAFAGLRNTLAGAAKRIWSYLPGRTSLFEGSRTKHLRNLDIDIGLGNSLLDSLLKKVGQWETAKDTASKTRYAIDFGRELLKGVMETADQFTVGATYEAFYMKGIQNDYSPEKALEYAEIMTGKTQANYFKEALPPFLGTFAGKQLGQFGTYGMNQWRMLIDDSGKQLIPGMESTRSMQDRMKWFITFLTSAYVIDTVSEKTFGRQPYDVKDLVDEGVKVAKGESSPMKFGAQAISTGITYVPFLGSVKYKSLPMTLEFGKDVLFATIGSGQTQLKAQDKLLDKWSFNLMLPYAGNQVRKAIRGMEAVDESQAYKAQGEDGDLDKPKFDIEGNIEIMKALLFGPYATESARTYYELQDDRRFLKGKYRIEGPILSEENIKSLSEMSEKEFKVYTNTYAESTIKKIKRKIKRRR